MHRVSELEVQDEAVYSFSLLSFLFRFSPGLVVLVAEGNNKSTLVIIYFWRGQRALAVAPLA